MNLLAYYLIHAGGPVFVVAILNFLVELIILAIVFYVVVWILGLVGIAIPARIMQLLMALFALLLLLSLFTGCASLTPAQKSAYSDAADTLGSAVVSNVASAATSDLQHGQPNEAELESAAVFGLFSGVSQIIGNGDASTIISSFSNGTMPKTAAAAKGVPLNDASLAAVAEVISSVAGAPPAK